MRPLKNLYREIVSLENLYRAAHATLARGRRYYGEGAWFSFHLEREVSRLHRELAAGAYRHGRYQIFQIRDPKPRTIAAAGFRDRVLHHAVHDVVEPRLDPLFIFDSYACRKGKGTHRALDRAHRFLRGSAYFVHLDVQRYFQSIDHAVLKGLLRRYVADADLLTLLDQIIDSTHYLAETAYADRGGRRITRREDGQIDLFAERPEAAYQGLPLGNLTSQLFANLYLNELDQFVKHRLKVRCYVRYLDDMALFAPDKATLHATERAIRAFAGQHLHLALHPSGGPMPARRGLSFLGFRLFPTHRRLKKTSTSRFIRRLNAFTAAYMAEEDPVEQAALRETIQRSVQSFDAHARHGNTFGLRRQLYGRFPLIDQQALAYFPAFVGRENKSCSPVGNPAWTSGGRTIRP